MFGGESRAAGMDQYQWTSYIPVKGYFCHFFYIKCQEMLDLHYFHTRK